MRVNLFLGQDSIGWTRNWATKGRNSIESFWSFAKARLQQCQGVAKHTFWRHLKESKFRFNHRHQHPYKLLLRAVSW